MSEMHPTARPARIDPHRLVAGAKVATAIASAVAFGAVAGLVVGGSGGSGAAAAAAPASTLDASGTAQATPAQDFFAVPPGFAQPPLADGGSGSGTSTGRAAPGQGGFGGQGFGGQVPNLRSSGS